LNGELPSLTPGRIAPLELTVRNDAQAVWPATAQVGIGNHWRPIDGTEVVFDHARAMIDEDLAPGRERNLRLEVMPPAKPGDYVLEIDLVQEWISWFADRGSTPLRIEVTVTAAPSAPEAPELVAERGQAAEHGGPFTPTMEMHAMPREEVIAVLEEAGGAVREAIASTRSTPSFPSVEYIVVRDTTPFRTAARRRPPDATSERRATGPAAIDEPGDLLGFALTSRSSRLARLSVLLRGILRRAMREVLHRQTEFNRASAESNRRLERQVESLSTRLESQEARIADLDRKLAGSDRQDR
jgi:hypothetical protein